MRLPRELNRAGRASGVEGLGEIQVLRLGTKPGQRRDREVLHPDHVAGSHRLLSRDHVGDALGLERSLGSLPHVVGEGLKPASKRHRKLTGARVPSKATLLNAPRVVKKLRGHFVGAKARSEEIDVAVVRAEDAVTTSHVPGEVCEVASVVD